MQKLSKQLSDIALGNYWSDNVLKQAAESTLLDSEERELLKLYAKGVRYTGIFHDIQEISVKLFNKGV